MQSPLDVVYFSSVSGNTARFVEKVRAATSNLTTERLPLTRREPRVVATRPFVLIVPTYGGGQGHTVETGAVPKQVIQFLNDPANRALMRGVVAAGNMNFGASFCLAGNIISRKCQVPYLHRFEIFGTDADVERVSSAVTCSSS